MKANSKSFITFFVSPVLLSAINDVPPANSDYRFGWSGEISALNIEAAEDEVILEKVYEAFNIGKRPAGVESLRSMSAGDIVRIDDRAYRCLPAGWQPLKGFFSTDERVPIQRIEDLLALVRVGARIGSISHHTFNGRDDKNELTFGDVVYPLRIVSRVEDTRFWLHLPEAGNDHRMDTWSDFAGFENFRVEENKLTVIKKVGDPGWGRVGELAEGSDFDWLTYWAVK